MRRRVVITGLGPISSIGIGIDAFKAGLREGRSGIAPITAFDTTGFPYRNGSEVAGFDPASFLRRLDPARWGRTSQLAAAAARLAAEDAGLVEELAGPRSGASMGTTMGEAAVIEELTAQWVSAGLPSLDGRLVRQVPASRLALAVNEELGMTGEAMTLGTACSASNYAIGYAADLIAEGDMDIMVAGGAESMCRWAHAGFYRLGAISEHACSPFDRDRGGILTGEGGAALVLESLDAARRRGARIYAELLGYGLSCDAHHMVAPNATGIAECMRRAHRAAGVHAREVDYVCAHGTGTPANDSTEVAAMRDVFGTALPPVSSIKSMLGHTMGAASGFGAIACAAGIADGFMPPTMNLRALGDDLEGIDAIPNAVREVPLRVAQNNGFAFGGNNAITILGALNGVDRRRRRGSTGGATTTLAITGWSVVSSLGTEVEDFAAALDDGRSGEVDTTGMFDVPLPGGRAFMLRDFSAREQLGRKGTSSMDRTTAMTISATGRALAGGAVVIDDSNRGRVGLVVGTTGSIRSSAEFSRETLVNQRPYLVNPSLFPSTVMNCAAGRAGIWHGLQGVNATVAGGQLSSLQALRYAHNVLRTGAADTIVVAGVEEMSPHSAWGHHSVRAGRGGVGPGEGCVAFVVQSAAAVRERGGVATAELLAIEIGVGAPVGVAAGPAAALADCVRRALATAGLDGRDVTVVSGSANGAAELDGAERGGLLAVLGDREVRRLCVKAHVGECFSAAGAMQLGALLAQPLLPGETGLVTSVSWDGGVAAAVVQGR